MNLNPLFAFISESGRPNILLYKDLSWASPNLPFFFSSRLSFLLFDCFGEQRGKEKGGEGRKRFQKCWNNILSIQDMNSAPSQVLVNNANFNLSPRCSLPHFHQCITITSKKKRDHVFLFSLKTVNHNIVIICL